jgi:hypothetical protein
MLEEINDPIETKWIPNFNLILRAYKKNTIRDITGIHFIKSNLSNHSKPRILIWRYNSQQHASTKTASIEASKYAVKCITQHTKSKNLAHKRDDYRNCSSDQDAQQVPKNFIKSHEWICLQLGLNTSSEYKLERRCREFWKTEKEPTRQETANFNHL